MSGFIKNPKQVLEDTMIRYDAVCFKLSQDQTRGIEKYSLVDQKTTNHKNFALDVIEDLIAKEDLNILFIKEMRHLIRDKFHSMTAQEYMKWLARCNTRLSILYLDQYIEVLERGVYHYENYNDYKHLIDQNLFYEEE